MNDAQDIWRVPTDAHTPGRWRVQPHPGGAWRIIGPGKRTRSEANLADILPRYDGQGAANARLMAAAPDLLKACRMAAAILEPRGDGEPSAAARAVMAEAQDFGLDTAAYVHHVLGSAITWAVGK